MNAITPLQRWKRDDWVIPCTLKDASSTPVDLTGSTLVAELWLAGYSIFQPLTVANGGVVRVSDTQGQFKVIAPKTLTAQAKGGLTLDDPNASTRILIAKIDSYGQRQTLGIVFFDVFDAADTRTIDQIPAAALVSQSTTLQLVVATAQGIAGPSSIPAAQISDSGAAGQAVMKAATAAAARQALGVVGNSRAAVNDQSYAVQATDTYVGVVALTAPRTITLPLAAIYPAGQPLYVADESGQCSTDHPIIVAAAGQDSIGNQASELLASPYQKAVFHSNGTNLWTV